MNQVSLSRKISNFLNRLIIAIYRHYRKAPSTKIDFVRYWGNKADFATENTPTWKVVMKVDKMIDECIATYGITDYKLKSLYELDSYDLKKAFILIEHGIIKPDDFRSDKPISKIVGSSTLRLSSLLLDPIWKQAFGNNELKEKARSVATDQKQYDDLHTTFASYYEWILRNQHYTEKIDKKIADYGVSIYLGVNLYDIDDIDFLEEAFTAIGEIWLLDKCWFVVSYNNVSIYELSEYTATKCRELVAKGDYTEVVFDEVRKADREEKNDYYEKQRLARNAAARERRAAKKAEKEAPAKKAKPVKKVAQKQPIKATKQKPVEINKPVKSTGKGNGTYTKKPKASNKKATVKSIKTKTKKAS